MPGREGAGDAGLVYSCSGCSNVAQLANHIAVRLDRLGIIEMSCIAGVGGDVRALVRKATAGRPVIAIDGCQLGCCEQVLAAKGVRPVRVVRLHELGLKKRRHVDFPAEEREAVFRRVLEELAPTLLAADPSLASRIDPILGGELGRGCPRDPDGQRTDERRPGRREDPGREQERVQAGR